jgi:two-component system, NarL family, nitrate/nitrite sensor histidine kinase NarX
MMTSSIQFKTGLLFLAFAVLVIISVSAAFWVITTQRADARIINYAGRQRMLVHYMTRLVLEYERDKNPNQLLELQEAIETFEATHNALSSGSQLQSISKSSLELSPPGKPALQFALWEVEAVWVDFKAGLIEIIQSAPDDQYFFSAISSVQALSYELIERLERLVSFYEANSVTKVNYLYQVQISFLSAAVLFLLISGRRVYHTLINPLNHLSEKAERIGKGDLHTPINVAGPLEIRCLGEALESMRHQLLDSQSQLQAWGKTLEEKVAQRTQELEALSTVSREISARLEISTVLQSITDKTLQLLSCETAFLCLLENYGKTLKLYASSGPVEAKSRATTQAADKSIAHLLSGEKALPCPADKCRSFCGIVSHPYQASHVAAPLRIENRVIGALCVGSSKPGVFTDESARLLMKLAYAAAIALENARLFEQVERTSTIEERQRIAAEMHDGLAQTISTLQMMVDLARSQLGKGAMEKAEETLNRGRAAIDQASADIRHAIASLQEDAPIYSTLQEEVTTLAEEFTGQGLNLLWEDRTASPIILPPHVSEHVLRVTREALLNAANHSGSKNISILLQAAADCGRIRVTDDGQGFNLRSVATESDNQGSKGAHFGLKIMQARAARIGGCLDIQTEKGKGTCVTLEWPLSGMDKVRQKNEKIFESNKSCYSG